MTNSDKLIYEEVKRRLVEQSASIKTIDTKAALILSFVGAILAGLVNSSWFNGLSSNYHFLILAPLALACIAALATLLVRSYRSDPDPKKLISGYKDKTEAVTRGQLTRNYEEVFTNNEPIILNKARLSKVSFVLLAVATIVLIFAILFANNNLQGDNTWQTIQHQHQPMYQQYQ
jgi:phosphate/sulfate permease